MRSVLARGLAAALLALAAAGLVRPAALAAQDTVVVIDPDAPPADTTLRPGLPPDVLRQAIAAYNDSAATRLAGDVVVAAGARWTGPVALVRGTLRVAGRIAGPVTVINGNLRVLDGGEIAGDVLVVGGRFTVEAGGRHTGAVRAFWDAAPVERQADGLLAERPPRRTVGDLATARWAFGTDRLRTTLVLATDGTYNRVEGLPIVGGPTVAWRPSPGNQLRLDLRGLLRTSADPSGLRSDVGYRADLAWTHEGHPGYTLGLRAHSVIDAIEDQPLGRGENGWSAFLLQTDYRDYYERVGWGGYAALLPVRGLRLEASYRYDREGSVPAGDPWSLFRNSDVWRANPLVDDGHFATAALRLAVDTRNDPGDPTSGWLLDARYEYARSTDVGPVPLPPEVRDPPPIDGTYDFNRVWFDLRRYTRLSAAYQLNLRVAGGGWVGGDALPVQRRVAVGGPDLLPGYPFRAKRCQGPLDDPARAALCDRSLAVQAELRRRINLGWNWRVPDPAGDGLDRVFGLNQLDLVLMGNLADGWLAGDGPGRVPANRLPALKEWLADVGIGADAGGIGVYFAKALTGSEPVRFTVRLQRRF